MTGRTVFLIAAVLVALASRTAHAQSRRGEQTALGLSAGVTAAGAGAIALGAASDRPSWTLIGIGSLAAVVGPSVGHVYAKDYFNVWMVVRAVSLGVGIGGLIESVCLEPCDSRKVGPTLVALAGATGLLVGTIGEIASAPAAARRYNRRHGLQLAITPAPVGVMVTTAW